MQRDHRLVAWLFFFCFITRGAALAAPAPPEPDDARVEKFEPARMSLVDVLERVRAAASGNRWLDENWTDPAIEGWLKHVVLSIRAAGHGKELREPLRMADYPRRVPAADLRHAIPGREPAGLLTVASRLDVTRLSNAVALVDGDASIGFAENCVIVARGAVRIAHGHGNVVVAGRFLHVSHDGSQRMMARRMAGRVPAGAQRPMPPASLLISGGALDVSHAGESVCVAAESMEISHATGCVFVNPVRVRVNGQNESVDVKVPEIRLGDRPPPHPLEADLKLRAAAGDVAVFWLKDRRYVAEVGAAITDETGIAVPALAGWELTIIDSDFACLSNEKERATIVLRRSR